MHGLGWAKVAVLRRRHGLIVHARQHTGRVYCRAYFTKLHMCCYCYKSKGLTKGLFEGLMKGWSQ